MGLLDDAIREHLDLKRRRGADPAEVERDEREALGPVRRNRESDDAPEAASAPAAGRASTSGSFAYDQDEDRDWTFDPSPEAAGPADGRSGRSTPDDDFGPPDFLDPSAAAEAPSDAEPLEEKPPEPPRRRLRRARPAADPEPDAAAEPEQAETDADPGDGETIEYNVDAAPPSRGDEARDEDVLEETPEFLQDTPDHDRLWFEQRPPRDFDFDG